MSLTIKYPRPTYPTYPTPVAPGANDAVKHMITPAVASRKLGSAAGDNFRITPYALHLQRAVITASFYGSLGMERAFRHLLHREVST